ncbi:hypothetical protein CPB83DRAFT_890343 [Crepidotus variabilis]|uniref:Uncharacterized protein n=1 Tax=Crepidotus variabilis TaxID=179855 RepID=A0A9P6EQU9_9AGAR|nr:hypothetical protein CPB83DRAFT_890343 [Crepidotus variabilis]
MKNVALNLLLKKAALGALHISEEHDAPRCHPETRVAVQDDILEQINISLVSTIVWLYEAAGATA